MRADACVRARVRASVCMLVFLCVCLCLCEFVCVSVLAFLGVWVFVRVCANTTCVRAPLHVFDGLKLVRLERLRLVLLHERLHPYP